MKICTTFWHTCRRFAEATALAVATAAPAAAQDVPADLLLKPAADSWPTYHGDYSGQHHRRFTQITPANVHQMTLAWAFQTNLTQQIKSTPIIAVTANVKDSRETSASILTIRFSTLDVHDSPSEVTLFLESDAKPHSYLVPIGCSPAWAWRSEIGRLELIASPGKVLKSPQVTALRINDLDEPDEKSTDFSSNQKLP